MEPVEITEVAPMDWFKWREPLLKFLDNGGDPSLISVEMLQGEVTEKELARYKDLWQREPELAEEE